MDEGFDQNSLSPDELAILQAFDALDLENIVEGKEEKPAKNASQPSHTASSDQDAFIPTVPGDEMLTLFVGEVEEDMSALREILQHVEPEEDGDLTPLRSLQRLAHKVKGTSAAFGCPAISTIAYYMEELTSQIVQGILVPFVGLHALVQAVYALEMTLNSVITYGEESDQPLAELEADYHALNIAIQQRNTVKPLPFALKKAEAPVRVLLNSTDQLDDVPAKHSQEHPSARSFVRVDTRRFEQLVSHSEELVELQAPLKNAQAEVEQALQELYIAQARLRQVEALVSINLFTTKSNLAAPSMNANRPTSSLVARILDEATQRTGHLYQRKSKHPQQWLKADTLSQWDALELDHFTENDVLIHSFDEAIADIVTASTRLRTALTHLNDITQAHMAQATNVRNDTLLLRLTPRTQGAVRSLLVRIGSHQVVVPFSQVQRIDEGKHYAPEECYSLNSLLGFPKEHAVRAITPSVLIVPANSTRLVVQVDEIIGDVELVVKPLAPHLQRPGIAGTVIDGMRNVMLVVDIPELVRHFVLPRPEVRAKITANMPETSMGQRPLAVLIADDSVYIRHSVRQTLTRAGYSVIEAKDGMKALELLVDQPPDVLLLDMEMPNLNGYDVLSMMRVHPELANVKVVMLTSHTAEKHQTHARELGAHVYLTKPCPDDILLSTLHTLLTS